MSDKIKVSLEKNHTGDKMKVRQGDDGYSYPYTSPDLVVDKNGKSNTTKFTELENKIEKVGSTSIDDTNTATDKTWSSSKIDTQFKDIVKQLEQSGSNNIFAVNLNHYNIGKIIDAPTSYTSHPFNCIRYDKDLDKLIIIFNAQISHYDRGNAYIATMDRNTFEISELKQITATDSSNNSYAIKSCVYSFVIDDNGDYNR